MTDAKPKTPSSGLVLYGVGRAAADLVYGSEELRVIDIEKLPNLHGKLNDKSTTFTTTTTDSLGKTHSSRGKISGGTPCTWIDLFGNRMLPVDVIKGERVLIWRYGNSSDYFWSATSLDTNFRTTEHYIIGVANRRSRKGEKLTRENTYLLELNTHSKLINLQTSKSDGEKYAYNITIDGKNGFLLLKDDVGQVVVIKSAEELVKLVNKSGSSFELNKKNVRVVAPGDYTAQVEGTYSINCNKMLVRAGDALFTIPTTTFTGAVTAASLTIGGGAGRGARAGVSCTVLGGMSVGGGLAADQIRVGAGGIQSEGPITAPNIP
jgi:hypothetical protein